MWRPGVAGFPGPPRGGDCRDDPLRGLHTSEPAQAALEQRPLPQGRRGVPADPLSPLGPASHLPAPRAVTLRLVKAEEGGMSHERCQGRPGQRQATRWQVPGG